MDRTYAVYILANRKHGALYTGVTSNLAGRMFQHREKLLAGFTANHGIDRLVWVEWHRDINAAILREKRIKRWRRQWKDELIEARTPTGETSPSTSSAWHRHKRPDAKG